jgi:hypothetical protein
MTARRRRAARPPRRSLDEVDRALLVRSFPYFFGRLRNVNGETFAVPRHLELWCRLFVDYVRLVLLAPRDHGKSTLGLAYILWLFYRHAHDPLTGAPLRHPAGTFLAVLMSATRDQALALMDRFRDLLAANAELFGPIGRPGTGPASRVRNSATHVRLASGAELMIRVFRTSTRGLHPNVLLLDDALSDANSGTQHQRDLSWRHLVGTLLPMHPGRLVIIGTAYHYDDLLHRLEPRSVDRVGGDDRSASDGQIFGFEWFLFPALDDETRTALWPDRHPVPELEALRAEEPSNFSREYQNDPRDDAASMFPFELTSRALDDGLTFLPTYCKGAGEVVVLGADLAISEAAAADFTSVVVVAYDRATGRRRVLYADRLKGLGLNQQLDHFAELCVRYNVEIGVVEQNGFAAWLLEAFQARPETRGRFLGENTGQEKTDFRLGVPGLKMAFLEGRWTMPSGDAESFKFAQQWRAELAAFGWKDGRLEGLGEHDDTVIATWYVERAIRAYERVLDQIQQDELIYIEDVIPGWKPARINPELD